MKKTYGDLSNKIKRIDHTIKYGIEREISKKHKEQMGQFFTPGNVIEMMLEILEPRISDKIVDPSCGCGNMLLHAHNYLYSHYGRIGENTYGLEIDEKLINICGQFHKDLKLNSQIIRCNALQFMDFDDSVDVVIGNPPFGRKLNSEFLINKNILSPNYQLQGQQIPSGRIEILFLQKCIRMLKEGGKMGFILPDGVLGNAENMKVREWLLSQGKIIAVIDLPLETFLPYTSVKTSVIFFQKIKVHGDNYKIFMAIADSCGHDRRGYDVDDDDISCIPEEFRKWNKKNDNGWHAD